MTKKTKLQQILNKLQGTDPKMLEGFRMFDEGVATLKKNLEESIKISTIDEVKSQIKVLQKKIDFNPLLEAIDLIKDEIELQNEDYSKQLSLLKNQLSNNEQELKDKESLTETRLQQIYKEGASLQSQISDLISRKPQEIPDFNKPLRETEQRLLALIQDDNKLIEVNNKVEEIKNDIDSSLKKLRADLVSMVSSHGGGNMNRNISIGGNSSVLSKFTDINLKAGSNVNITYANNQITNNVDITISATGGGGGSVTGIVRSVNRVATSQVMGATAGTDYVYIATQGVKLDLPTAVGNTNLYTVKNISNSSVLVATTSAQTIDDDPEAILATKYVEITLHNSGNDNWNIGV